MSEIANLERVRTAALAHVEKSEKRFKLALFIAGLLELVFLVSFVLCEANRLTDYKHDQQNICLHLWRAGLKKERKRSRRLRRA